MFASRGTALRTSALEPTSVKRSSVATRPSAHGWRGFPVQMRALMTASVGLTAGMGEGATFRPNDRDQSVVLDRFHRLRVGDVGARPWRVSAHAARGAGERGRHLDGGM